MNGPDKRSPYTHKAASTSVAPYARESPRMLESDRGRRERSVRSATTSASACSIGIAGLRVAEPAAYHIAVLVPRLVAADQGPGPATGQQRCIRGLDGKRADDRVRVARIRRFCGPNECSVTIRADVMEVAVL